MPKGFKSVIEELATEVIIDMGNGVVIARTSESVANGTTGTLAGQAGKGSLLINDNNGKLYINTSTLASPTWTVVGTQT